MKLKEISRQLGLGQVDQDFVIPATEVESCYIGDLLSNVIAHAQAGDIWLTVQTHCNVVAVAALLNLAAIVFVEGHQPQTDTILQAHAAGVPLFSWPASAYELARELSQAGIGSEAK